MTIQRAGTSHRRTRSGKVVKYRNDQASEGHESTIKARSRLISNCLFWLDKRWMDGNSL